MTTPNVVTADEAVVIRAVARGDAVAEFVYAPRIFLPIEKGHLASGRAACRECGRTIPNGESCIQFEFDVYGGLDRWGKLSTAYLHEACPPREEESDERATS